MVIVHEISTAVLVEHIKTNASLGPFWLELDGCASHCDIPLLAIFKSQLKRVPIFHNWSIDITSYTAYTDKTVWQGLVPGSIRRLQPTYIDESVTESTNEIFGNNAIII